MGNDRKKALSYDARFGREMVPVVAAARQRLEELSKLAPKYQNWFGGAVTPEQKAEELRKFEKMKVEAVTELAEKTKRNMNALGQDSFDEFARHISKMMPRLQMARSIKSFILNPEKAEFGSCRIGRVTLDNRVEAGRRIVTEMQVYTTNFETDITTTRGSDMYVQKGTGFGTTFFGVAIDIDTTTGAALGFNKTHGRDGVLFVTSSLDEAFVYMAAKVSGKSVAEVVDIYKRVSLEEAARKHPANAPTPRPRAAPPAEDREPQAAVGGMRR